MEQVKWSCKACNSSGAIEYDPPGNPYEIGYQSLIAHSEAFPNCRNILLDYEPKRLGPKFASLRRTCSTKGISDEVFEERRNNLVKVLGEENLNKMLDGLALSICCQEAALATVLWAVETLGFMKKEE